MMKHLILTLFLLCSWATFAQQYNASLFGIKSDGTTNNTGSINRAMVYISENGGGELHFYVGRYLTGTIEIKENVKIVLHEGAVILGSTNPYDYPQASLLYSQKENRIEGTGVIDMQQEELKKNFADQLKKGFVQGPVPTPLSGTITTDSNIIIK